MFDKFFYYINLIESITHRALRTDRKKTLKPRNIERVLQGDEQEFSRALK